MRLIVATVVIAPIALAYAVTVYMFGSLTPANASFDGSGEGYLEVLLSFTIMFCIAAWIGGGFVWLTLKLAKARAE
jgi:hypothetical protein